MRANNNKREKFFLKTTTDFIGTNIMTYKTRDCGK